jgi:hypothetical protein
MYFIVESFLELDKSFTPIIPIRILGFDKRVLFRARPTFQSLFAGDGVVDVGEFFKEDEFV